MIAGARRRDDPGADVLGELDRKPGDPAGAAVDEDGFAGLEVCGVFECPDRSEARQRHRGGLGMSEEVGFFGDDRGLDRDFFGVAALDTGITHAEHLIADREIA